MRQKNVDRYFDFGIHSDATLQLMRKILLFALTLAIGLSFTGCAHIPTPAEISAAPREPMPNRYALEEQLKGYWRSVLADPESARFEFAEPEPWYSNRFGDQTVYGWKIRYSVNGKNAFGGYAGAQMHVAFYYQGRLRYTARLFNDGSIGSPKMFE